MFSLTKTKFPGLVLALILGTVVSAYAIDSPSSKDAAAQEFHKVSGNVTDTKGEPLIGAYVVMKGNDKVYSLTDLDGNYTLELPEADATLVFSFIGYTKTEERVSGRKILNVQLSEQSTELGDAVVVAYGRQKRESVVASITSIAPEQLKVSTSRSISNNLAGTVAGVLAIQRSGEPGYDNSTFWIRGISTFQGAGGNPLVLIDGIERDINNIDAEQGLYLMLTGPLISHLGSHGPDIRLLVSRYLACRILYGECKRNVTERPVEDFTYTLSCRIPVLEVTSYIKTQLSCLGDVKVDI